MSNIKFGLKGRYRLIVRRPDDSIRIETPWFDNLILNEGLNQIGVGGIISYCHVGTGNAAATEGDTGLSAPLASTTVMPVAPESGNNVDAPYCGWVKLVFRFDRDTATGNLSEVGVGWADFPGNLFSRALIRDEVGDPTTITVLAGETLDVIYELRVYPPSADQPFSVNIGGELYTGVIRPAYANSSGFWTNVDLLRTYGSTFSGGMAGAQAGVGTLGSDIEVPTGEFYYFTSYERDPYSNNSYTASTVMTADPYTLNLPGGLDTMLISYWGLGEWQASFSPPIPKTETNELKLRFAITWARREVP